MQQHGGASVGLAGGCDIQVSHFQRLLLRSEREGLDRIGIVEAFQARAIAGFLRHQWAAGQGQGESADKLSHRDLRGNSAFDGTHVHVVIAFNVATRVRERLLCRISSLRLISGAMHQARGVAASLLLQPMRHGS